MFTLSTLQKLWPHGDSKISGLLEAISNAAPSVFLHYGVSSDLVTAHMMAQFSEECGAGTEMVENIHYSADRAVQVWPSRFDAAHDVYNTIRSFEGDPMFATKLMDNVYGGRNGNRPGTHDGSTFIGRGLSQVTGRANYQALGAKVGLDLVNHPEFVNSLDHVLECGVADFILCGCFPFAEQDNLYMVTQKLNGGQIGASERSTWLHLWKKQLNIQ